MSLLVVCYWISVTLTILSVALLFATLVLHSWTDRVAHHNANFRREAEPAVRAYLAGGRGLEDVVKVLSNDTRDALRLLVETAEDASPQERERILVLFAEFPFVAQELARLKSRRRDVRLQAAQILGYLQDLSAAPELREVLVSDDYPMRLAAARSLALLGQPEDVLPIVRALDVPGEVPRRRLAEILATFGPAAIPPLLEILRDPGTTDTALTVVARVCGMLRAAEAAPRLMEILNHPDKDVRLNGVRALAALQDSTAIPAIARLVGDPAWEVRSSVMRALGDLQAVDEIPNLARRLADEAWWVRFSAAEAMHRLSGPGLEALRNAASHHSDRYARDISQQVLQEHNLEHSTPESRT